MVARRPRVPPSLHAPLYTRAQVRALTQYGPYIRAYLEVERWRRGCKATATPPPSMLLLFAKRCIILSAMPGISKRNTSGFAIVLRICSPIHNLPLHGLLLLLLTSLRSIHAATSPPFCVSWRGVDPLRRSHCFPYVRDLNRDWSTVARPCK